MGGDDLGTDDTPEIFYSTLYAFEKHVTTTSVTPSHTTSLETFQFGSGELRTPYEGRPADNDSAVDGTKRRGHTRRIGISLIDLVYLSIHVTHIQS